MYRRCLRLLRDREAARDATQEVFVKLLRESERLGEPRSATAWIYQVATHHCLNVLRARRRHGEGAGDAGLELVGSAPPDLAGRHLAQSVLARFDAETQAIAVGVLVDGLEHEELAGALGISRRTVHRKLTRFLEKARALLGAGEARDGEGRPEQGGSRGGAS